MSVNSVTNCILFMADDYGVQPGDYGVSGKLCPICEGGATKEKSFSLGRSPVGVWYKCWRVKCNARGFIEENGTRTEHTGPSLEDSKKSQEEAMIKTVRFQIEREPFPREQKFRIQAYDGRVKGVHLRRDDYRATYIYPGEVAGGFFWPTAVTGEGGPVVVVEDPISAEAVAKYALAYCLFGTNLSEDKIAEIVGASYPRRSIWLCLDKDATVKAAEYVLKYRFLAPNLKLMPIQKDLKHWSDEELRKFIYG